MSKAIRQKIVHAIQTFRSAPLSSTEDEQSYPKSKMPSCCSVSKPRDYESIPYEPRQPSRDDDYVDLSECRSWSSSISRDSGISFDENLSSVSASNENLQQFQSTRIHSEESTYHLTLSDMSSIRPDEMNLSNFDVTAWYTIPTSFECCHCHCHHRVNADLLQNPTNNYLYFPQEYRERRTKNQMFPFIF